MRQFKVYAGIKCVIKKRKRKNIEYEAYIDTPTYADVEVPASFRQREATNIFYENKTHVWYENPYWVTKFKSAKDRAWVISLVSNLLSCSSIEIENKSRDNLAKYLLEWWATLDQSPSTT